MALGERRSGTGRVTVSGMVHGRINGTVHGMMHATVDGDIDVNLISGSAKEETDDEEE